MPLKRRSIYWRIKFWFSWNNDAIKWFDLIKMKGRRRCKCTPWIISLFRTIYPFNDQNSYLSYFFSYNHNTNLFQRDTTCKYNKILLYLQLSMHALFIMILFFYNNLYVLLLLFIFFATKKQQQQQYNPVCVNAKDYIANTNTHIHTYLKECVGFKVHTQETVNRL